MKKFLMMSVVASLLLTACQATTEKKETQTASSSKQASSQSSSTAQSSSTSSSSSVAAKTYWSADLAKQLEDYIFGYWGPAMGQVYQSYTPSAQGNFYGVTIPNDLLVETRGKLTPDLGGQTPQLVWRTDGVAPVGQLAVVAVYSDIEQDRNMNKHLYVFTIDSNGVGQTWITQQNQGNNENKFYFTETKNEELRQFFSQLVGGGAPTSTTQAQATTAIDTKNLTTEQAARWAAAHKAREYGAPYTREDFLSLVTGIDRSSDGLVYIEVRENHDSPTMRAAGADPNVASAPSFYRINAAGQLEVKDILSGTYTVVETNYYE